MVKLLKTSPPVASL